MSMARKASSTGFTPLTRAARNSWSSRSSCTSTATSADRHQASVPGMLELPARVLPVKGVLDPALAGLLLGQRARAIAGAERAQEGAAVAAAEVVALAAAAVVEDRLAAVRVAEAA